MSKEDRDIIIKLSKKYNFLGNKIITTRPY